MSLVKSNSNLPANIEDLSKFVLVGREKLTAVRAEIKAIDKIGLAKEVREQKKQEAQYLGEALLDAEARIGDILKQIPKQSGKRNDLTSSHCCEKVKSKQQLTKELGFNKDMAQRFETLADNIDVIEQVKADARQNEDIPTRTEVLNRVKKLKRQEQRNNINTEEPKPLNGQYDVIYADPPWRYDFAESENRAIENNYPTMDIEDIKDIKVPSADKSVLFLWATAPKLLEALEVMKAWGFEYKTQSIWDKELIGSGYWFRGQHEILLVGVKGKFSPPEPSKRKSSVYREKRTKHSSKPQYYYQFIEESFPNQRYLEMFSRFTYSDKWTVWGNQSE